MDSVRLRLAFEDRHILSKSQKSNGLKRSWLLLKPQLETISDLSSHLIDVFDLDRSCPNGILLSMDGFVLPLFESTSILKDKDIISVKKKGALLLSDITKLDDEVKLIEEEEIVEKQPVHTGLLLLANEEFEQESGGYQSETEEDEDNQSKDILLEENSSGRNVASKKRKASPKLESSTRKKKRPKVPEAVESDVQTEEIENFHHHTVRPGKIHHKKKKESDANSKPDIASTPKIIERSDSDCMLSAKRCGQLQENGTGNVEVPHKPDASKKASSRSARRKKAKRQWLRELTKAEKEELRRKKPAKKDMHKSSTGGKGLRTLFPNQNSDVEDEIVPAKKEMHKSSTGGKGLRTLFPNQNSDVEDEIVPAKIEMHKSSTGGKGLRTLFPNQNSDVEDEIVPVVIRPGHIRFEPLGEEKTVQQNQQNQVSVGTSQWNGITSKKKGQKWGKEKNSSSWSDYKDFNKECSEPQTIVKEVAVNGPTDFDKLPPFSGLPKEGDVIAYRLLELSSTWTPELSSFRVGKTSLYDSESNRIVLTPVPEYPVVLEKQVDEEASAQQPDVSPYKEDGSLEIDFSSLVDVRIVEHGNSDPAKAVTSRVDKVPMCNTDSVSSTVPKNNDKQTVAPTPEKEVNTWDEISEALNKKKAQLSQENGWNKETSGRSPWSYRALRKSALGPTMALLRSRKDI
ncbi:coilin isoform X2 [Cornus florida]|uniref:coilin isoform X2 n=1 Tax=Cornus florida TaxID=4283 RepID=UPI00289D50E8|nr:coilin isoform X2 [Cornus florida]